MSNGTGSSLPQVVDGAVGSFDGNCMGYMNPGASGYGYISTMKLSVDKVDVQGLDPGAAGIVSYDRCEKDDAYIGQINMGTASSFCGVNGALWGYHLAIATAIADGSLKPMFTYPGPLYPPDEKLPTQGPVPVYPVGPLLDAAERLFGRMDKSQTGEKDLRRFSPLPGAHVICANKDASAAGPGYFWAAIGIAMADDRETQANLFIEDADVIVAKKVTSPEGTTYWTPTPQEVRDQLHQHLRNVTKSMVLCGQDQDVVFTEIFAGVKFIFAGEGEWGCALTCAPYVTLARNAVPTGQEPSGILEMTIDQWEAAVGLSALPPAPVRKDVGGIGVPAGEA
ncbi:MAG TPA: histidine decarboxylase, pyruvoyl type [Egibacteraceae bacterium]|nr:histidine decarboxylase, pyruvoyl type [Actinomycetota bacterium]HWB72164.1 histidine decarboxylase, pyruvoyl type [Egibacteraceae bacterium]